MAKLIEFVPNFSDGRRPEVIDAIVEAMVALVLVDAMLLQRSRG